MDTQYYINILEKLKCELQGIENLRFTEEQLYFIKKLFLLLCEVQQGLRLYDKYIEQKEEQQ